MFFFYCSLIPLRYLYIKFIRKKLKMINGSKILNFQKQRQNYIYVFPPFFCKTTYFCTNLSTYQTLVKQYFDQSRTCFTAVNIDIVSLHIIVTWNIYTYVKMSSSKPTAQSSSGSNAYNIDGGYS